MKPHVLALDAGGGGGHAVLVDVETRRVTRAFRPWRHPSAPGTGGLGVDLDLDEIWRRLADAAREALARSGAAPTDVAGIAATSMRHTTIVLAENGDVLLATPNRDTRAIGEMLELDADAGESVYASTGHWPAPIFGAFRLVWLSRQGDDRWRRARQVVTLSDWIASRLCGRVASDVTQASETLLLDVADRTWSEALCERLGVPARLLPPLRPSGERLGTLSREAAADLGLAEGIPVAVGGADTQCGLLGTGAVDAGETAIIGGTTVPLQTIHDGCRIDPGRRMWTSCHLAPGQWVVESNAGAMGEMLTWIARALFPRAAGPEARLLAEASLRDPGQGGVLSSLGTRVMDARRMDLPIGWLGLTHMATMEDPERRAHVARAFVDGAAFAIRANLEQIAGLTGDHRAPLHFAGGLARDRGLARTIAEVTGRPVSLGPTFDATALGAAVCAGVGAGLFRDLRDGVRRLVAPGEALVPAPERVALYDGAYPGWTRLRAAQSQADDVARDLVLPAVLGSLARRAEESGAATVHPRILVTAHLEETSLARLRQLGDVEDRSFRETMQVLTGDDLVAALDGFQVFITEIDLVDAASLERLPDLRVVTSCRGDAVNVDVEACAAFGIPVLHTPGRNADAVADLTIAFLLALARRLPQATAFLRQPGIQPGDVGRMGQAFLGLRGRELWRKTIGLIGLGAVGRTVARRLEGFGARVLAYDPKLADARIVLAGAEPATLGVLLAESDFVSLHAAVTDETRGMIGARELASMKPGAFLINTARAALLDEDALYESLASGRLAGAALDVFSVEPPGSSHPLLRLESVIATPHVGGNTDEVGAHQGEIAATDLERLLRGQRPLHVLDPSVLADFDWSAPRRTPDARTLRRLRERPPPTVRDASRASAPSAPSASAGAARPDAGEPTASGEMQEAMGRILAAFVGRVAENETLRTFAEGKDVTLRFTLPDVGLSFYVRLHAGAVAADMGNPSEPPSVDLRMRAEVLDGILRGTVNGMQAATQGRLSFTGDVMKAMTLQTIQPELARAYAAARAEAGDPGDLSSIPEPTPSGPRSRAPTAAAGGDLRDAIVTVIEELYEAELVTATGGNVSAREPGSNEIWITPSQLFKGKLTPDLLVRIDLGGAPLDPDTAAPSSERLMHSAVYQARPEACAVIHAHAPNVTVLADAGLPFLPVSTEAAFFGEIPRLPFFLPGTRELADAVGAAMRESWAVILQNHGLLVAGRSLRRAADMVEVIERSAEIIVGCHAVGRTPTVLPADVVERLRRMGDMLA